MRRVTHHESAGSRAASLLAEPVLVVKQRLKLVELRNDYGVFDPGGRPIGAVAQVGQSPLAFLARLFTSWDVALPITLEIRGLAGVELLVKKPWFTWRCQVTRADGLPLGYIVKQIRLGKARFTLLDPGGAELGEVRAENWRAKDFSVRDGAGQELARVTKRWAGMRELFTDADTYVVEVRPTAADPLRSLAVASCLVIDVIMKQKDYS
jgi:Scramblase